MSNINFFRVMAKGNSIEPQPPVLTCALQLGDFSLGSGNGYAYQDFRFYGATFFSDYAIGSTTPGGSPTSQSHYLYTGWWPTGTLTSPYPQKIFQFEQTNTNFDGSTAPDLSAMTVYTSSVNNTNYFQLNASTMGSELSQNFRAFQTMQVPNTGSLIIFMAAVQSFVRTLIQYDLDTNFDITTLNTASRETADIRRLTGSTSYIKQTSFNQDGTQLYQYMIDSESNISPFYAWAVLHVIDLSTPYDLSSYSSATTSSYILNNELSNMEPKFLYSDKSSMNTSTIFDVNTYGYTNQIFKDEINGTTIKFRVNSNRTISNEELISNSAFPDKITYSSPKIYPNYSTIKYEQLFVSNSLAPESYNSNIDRTGSCLAPYLGDAGWVPV